ncbi:MAG TPA: cytochrome c peroxidase, partial [Kofleriaceae bacterium]|nr:cytochrome c peroxidase [Kofleriaceae bacterium]
MAVAIALSGCWAEEDRIGDTFTADQLAHLRAQFRPPAVPDDPCAVSDGGPLPHCDQALLLGTALYFDQALSSTGKVSCKSCHDPASWFIDSRPDNARSLGANGWTKRNSVSLVNLALKPP